MSKSVFKQLRDFFEEDNPYFIKSQNKKKVVKRRNEKQSKYKSVRRKRK